MSITYHDSPRSTFFADLRSVLEWTHRLTHSDTLVAQFLDLSEIMSDEDRFGRPSSICGYLW